MTKLTQLSIAASALALALLASPAAATPLGGVTRDLRDAAAPASAVEAVHYRRHRYRSWRYRPYISFYSYRPRSYYSYGYYGHRRWW